MPRGCGGLSKGSESAGPGDGSIAEGGDSNPEGSSPLVSGGSEQAAADSGSKGGSDAASPPVHTGRAASVAAAAQDGSMASHASDAPASSGGSPHAHQPPRLPAPAPRASFSLRGLAPEESSRARSAPAGMQQLPLPAAPPLRRPDEMGREFDSMLLGLLLADPPPVLPPEQDPHAALLDGLGSLHYPGLDTPVSLVPAPGTRPPPHAADLASNRLPLNHTLPPCLCCCRACRRPPWT